MKGYDNFFMVERESFDFKDFKFLTKAISTDENRYFMNFVNAESEADHIIMVATDGRRLHIVHLSKEQVEMYEIQTGSYKVICNDARQIIFAHVKDAKECGTFPNWRKVLPEGEPEKTQTIEIEKWNTRSIINFSRNLDEQESFDIDYFNDLSGFDR